MVGCGLGLVAAGVTVGSDVNAYTLCQTQPGNRIVLFAPVYLANYCVNSCTSVIDTAGRKYGLRFAFAIVVAHTFVHQSTNATATAPSAGPTRAWSGAC